MNYIVLEIQKNSEGQISTIPYAFATETEALAKYYQILSVAALSGLKKHGAVILTDEGFSLRYDCFVDSNHIEPVH